MGNKEIFLIIEINLKKVSQKTPRVHEFAGSPRGDPAFDSCDSCYILGHKKSRR